MNKINYSLSSKWLKKNYIFLSALAILAGGFIYIFLRTSEPRFFNWVRAAGLGHWFTNARSSSFFHHLNLPMWVINSLPDGLWAFAYAAIITGIWSGSRSWYKYIWLASIPVLVLGCELLQYPGIIQGTFSIQDLIFGIAGLALGIMVMSNYLKPGNHE